MYGLINVPIARISKYPTQECELLDEVFYGSYVKILEELVNYCIVKTSYYYYGLIRKQDIIILGEKIDHFTTFNGIITKPFVDVLAEPKYQSYPIITIPKGSYVKIVEEEAVDGWQEVELVNEKRGYIRENHFKLRTQPDLSNEQNLRKNIVNHAMSYLGVAYRWGGKTSLGIDCSGLTSISYLLEELLIHRDSKIDEAIIEKYSLRTIEPNELKIADLIYSTGHVMMYIGNDKYIHSSSNASSVIISSLNPNDPDYRPVEIITCATLF